VGLNGASWVILVVEDEWLIRSVIVHALREADFVVLEATTAQDAIALLRAGTPRIDAIFTDIQMPGDLCGWDVAENGRALRADLPVIYTSGNAADRSRSVAGSMFFDKPYSTTDVVAACWAAVPNVE
jgi:two-component system, response regulator PdtaR